MDNVKKNKWFIAIKERGQDIFDLKGLKVIEPKEGTYHADPFLFRDLIFFELYDYNKGVIACMDKEGKNIQKVLECPYHLSFPFIFEDEGNVYMIPESGMAGRIELWQCVKFPDQWQLVKTLVNGVFGDPVLYKQGKQFYLFATEGDNDLRIFRADSLLQEKWDKVYAESIENSRGAGKIFEFQSKLVRPTQGGKNYGEALYFKEFFLPYQEVPIKAIEPNWMEGLTGTHTFNFDNTHVVIDGRIKL